MVFLLQQTSLKVQTTLIYSVMLSGLGPSGNQFPTYEMDSLVFSSACFCLLRPFR